MDVTTDESIKKEFLKHCERRDLSEGRIRKYMVLFEELKELRIRLDKLDREAIDRYYFYLKNSKYKQWTKVTKWKMFKKVCKFVDPSLEYLLRDYVMKEPKMNPEILTMDEIRMMVLNANDFKDKLLILLLYESGAKIGELLNIRKSDIIFDDYGAIIKVCGKTGMRPIRIVACADLLRAYVKTVYDKLFDVSERAVNKMLKNVAKRCGIKKRIYPHIFRHTRATHLAKYLTEPELRLYFGWSEKSEMPGVYVHLAMRDLDHKILALNNQLRLSEKCLYTTSNFNVIHI